MLVDKEEAKEVEKEGVRALKRRKKQKASTFTPIDVSFKGI